MDRLVLVTHAIVQEAKAGALLRVGGNSGFQAGLGVKSFSKQQKY